MAKKSNNWGGARPGAGNPGLGKMKYLKKQVEYHSADWWAEWEKMMKSEDKDLKKFAMQEFNKLQVKMIPQDITSDGEKVTPILSYVSGNNGNDKGDESKQED